FSGQVSAALKNVFKLDSFRANQLEIINATLNGRDCFVLMPTGGGKSLCYQLPSLVNKGKTNGITFVISPLLSLIQDQVEKLVSIGIPSIAITGEMSQEKRKGVFQELKRNSILKLCYITPELIAKSQQFQSRLDQLYREQAIARFVVDEAHCLSQWGHDFRPDYKQLSTLRRNYPEIPIMALTATANLKVKNDITQLLGLRNIAFFQSSFNRPNLSYEVREKKGNMNDEIRTFIQTYFPTDSGIIYINSKRKCEQLSDILRSKGVKTAFYHAAMAKADRHRVQREWQDNKIQVIVATIAFGMGIDKADVRFVIHGSLPNSLEGYYQETGRAGRDGLPSKCLMFWSFADRTQIISMIHQGEGDWEQKERQRNNLRQVLEYADNRFECRRTQVLRYFGEKFNPRDCRKTCDNCLHPRVSNKINIIEHVRDLIEIVHDVQRQQVGLHHVADIYKGSRLAKIVQHGHHNHRLHGTGKALKKTVIERILQHLIIHEALEEYNVSNKMGFNSSYIRTARNAHTVKTGNQFLFESEDMQVPSIIKALIDH
ncbi:P-loop containing nucleoside triphosphate hydrolase protein, partial [Gorgonomyces haynaldii]